LEDEEKAVAAATIPENHKNTHYACFTSRNAIFRCYYTSTWANSRMFVKEV